MNSLIQDAFGYPLHDAVIAAGARTGAPLIDLPAMLEIMDCYDMDDSQDLANQFEAVIPEIIDDIFDVRTQNHGRVVEHGDSSYLVGDNYVLNQRFATVSCVVELPALHYNTVFTGPSAYASHLLVHTDISNPLPNDSDPFAFSLSSLMEADVMELPSAGVFYVPRRLCLDFKDKSDVGISSGGDLSQAFTAELPVRRTESAGTRSVAQDSTMNRVMWIDNGSLIKSNPDPSIAERVLASMRQPQAELIGLAAHLDSDLPKDCLTQPFAEQSDRFACLAPKIEAQMLELGLGPIDLFAVDVDVADQYLYLSNIVFDYLDPFANFDPDIFQTLPQFPSLLDPSIAAKNKNAIGTMEIQPFWDQDRAIEFLRTANASRPFLFCLQTQSENSIANSTTDFVGALERRRARGNDPRPLQDVTQWANFDPIAYQALYPVNEAVFSEQRTQWTRRNSGWQLNEGNLTQDIIGRTADWMLMNVWENGGQQIQELLSRHRNSMVFSQANNNAVELDSPCDKAASDTDIFLFVLAMLFLAFSGDEIVVTRIEVVADWWMNEFRRYRCGKGRDEPVVARRHKCPRMLMHGFTLLTIGALYLPLVLQIVDELEVSNFSTQVVQMEAMYSDVEFPNLNEGAHHVLVTLVESSTECESARPQLLVGLLIGGILLSLCVNMPRMVDTFCICCTKVPFIDADEEETKKIIIYDEKGTSVRPATNGPSVPADDSEQALDATEAVDDVDLMRPSSQNQITEGTPPELLSTPHVNPNQVPALFPFYRPGSNAHQARNVTRDPDPGGNYMGSQGESFVDI